MSKESNLESLREMYKAQPPALRNLEAMLTALQGLPEPEHGLATLPRHQDKLLNIEAMLQCVRLQKGFDVVEKDKKWDIIVEDSMGIRDATPAFIESARKHYKSLMLPYERSLDASARQKTQPAEVKKADSRSTGAMEAQVPSSCSGGGGGGGGMRAATDAGTLELPAAKRFAGAAYTDTVPFSVPKVGFNGNGNGYGNSSMSSSSTATVSGAFGGSSGGGGGGGSNTNNMSAAQAANHAARVAEAELMSKYHHEKSIKAAVHGLESNDPAVIVTCLNALTIRSFHDATDRRSAESGMGSINLEKQPLLLKTLGKLLDLFNPIDVTRMGHVQEHWVSLLDEKVALQEWPMEVPDSFTDEDRLLITTLGGNEMLKVVLNIVRNLAFDISNQVLLAYSMPIMRHIVCLVVVSSTFTEQPLPEVCRYACDILLNLGKHIDLTGRKRTSLDLWLTPVKSFAKNKMLEIMCNDNMSNATQAEYQATTFCLLPWISRIVCFSRDREEIIRALDTLGRLASLPENAPYFTRAPDLFYRCLVSMMAVTHTSADPISGPMEVIRCHRMEATSAHGLYMDVTDVEIRDLTIDAVHAICAQSPSIQVRLAQIPHCVPMLIRLVQLWPEFERFKPEWASKAAQILTSMASHEQNIDKFSALKTELQNGLFSDDSLLDLYVNVCTLINNKVNMVAAPATVMLDDNEI
jgi:hypothetical protein